MAKRILILSASVGSGHIRAAQAVEAAIRALDPGAAVLHRDVLELTTAAFRRLYGKAYLDLANHAPHLLGYLYDLLDRPRSPRRRSDRLRLAWEKLNLRPFLKFLREGAWDLIVNTHFLPAEIIGSLRRKGKMAMRQFIVTTDFDPHRFWIQEPVERYFTATEEGKVALERQGVEGARIRATGIPIDPAFAVERDRKAACDSLGIPGDRPLVVQLAGGFGIGPVERLFRELLEIEVPLDVIAVAGRNEGLKRRLDGTRIPARHRVKVLGFTDRMADLLAAADLVVSKPGGLTTSEVLARGAAMAVVNPIPGQESRNSDFLLENGAAVKINNPATIAFKLGALLGDPSRLAALKRNSKSLGKPRAAFDVARAALEDAGPG